MKICPTCQAKYPNGFQFCPTDTEALVTVEDFANRVTSPQTPVAPVSPVTEVIPLSSYRQTTVIEPVRPSPPTPTPSPQAPQTAEIPRTAQRIIEPEHTNGWSSEPAAVAVSAGGAATVRSAFQPGFQMPPSPGLFENLTTSLRQFVKEFGKPKVKAG